MIGKRPGTGAQGPETGSAPRGPDRRTDAPWGRASLPTKAVPPALTPSKQGPHPTSRFYRNSLKTGHGLNGKGETVNLPEENVHGRG